MQDGYKYPDEHLHLAVDAKYLMIGVQEEQLKGLLQVKHYGRQGWQAFETPSS
jgi:hypothetical protein